MRIDRTEWPKIEEPITAGGNILSRLEQPGFGIEVCWNDPKKLWKPFLALRFWCWLFQIGWLAGENDVS